MISSFLLLEKIFFMLNLFVEFVTGKKGYKQNFQKLSNCGCRRIVVRKNKNIGKVREISYH